MARKTAKRMKQAIKGGGDCDIRLSDTIKKPGYFGTKDEQQTITLEELKTKLRNYFNVNWKSEDEKFESLKSAIENIESKDCASEIIKLLSEMTTGDVYPKISIPKIIESHRSQKSFRNAQTNVYELLSAAQTKVDELSAAQIEDDELSAAETKVDKLSTRNIPSSPSPPVQSSPRKSVLDSFASTVPKKILESKRRNTGGSRIRKSRRKRRNSKRK